MTIVLYIVISILSILLVHRVYVLLVQTNILTARSISTESLLAVCDEYHDDTTTAAAAAATTTTVATSIVKDGDEKLALIDANHQTHKQEHGEALSYPPFNDDGLLSNLFHFIDLIRADLSALPGAAYGSYVPPTFFSIFA